MKLLIAGDSFAADWSIKYPESRGWPNLLAEKYQTDNVAQAGCSEYRIYQQLLASDLDNYDLIIVSHTSPYRIYTEYNPLRSKDLMHHHCDLLYSDVKNLAKHHSEYTSVVAYFEKFFSLDYAEFCYATVREKINELIKNHQVLHLAHVNLPGVVDLDFSQEFKNNPGTINHYNVTGNQNIYQRLIGRMQSL